MFLKTQLEQVWPKYLTNDQPDVSGLEYTGDMNGNSSNSLIDQIRGVKFNSQLKKRNIGK